MPIKEKINCDYVLQKNSVIQYKGEMYTNSNITNEIAEAFIAENSNRSKVFEKLPTNESRINTTGRKSKPNNKAKQ